MPPEIRFQSAPPHGGRQGRARGGRLQLPVSIRAPARGATAAYNAGAGNIGFQSAPPHGGRQGARPNPPPVDQFQSAPPHGGRPPCIAVFARIGAVSIRAPARGATPAQPHRRASLPGFNPRPRTGGDFRDPLQVTRLLPVSIRAPARGATERRWHDAPGELVSIRAPARGATWKIRSLLGLNAFQSAPPHGGRLEGVLQPRQPADSFNPRPRTGGDLLRRSYRPQSPVSIRAPARGATLPAGRVRDNHMFQSAPPHGGRPDG